MAEYYISYTHSNRLNRKRRVGSTTIKTDKKIDWSNKNIIKNYIRKINVGSINIEIESIIKTDIAF